MAKRLTWSVQSVEDRGSIFNYWDTVNKSNVYSLKLDALFEETSELLLNFPFIGKSTNKINIRFVVIRNYSVFYEIVKDDEIFILTIWDNRQNPEELNI